MKRFQQPLLYFLGLVVLLATTLFTLSQAYTTNAPNRAFARQTKEMAAPLAFGLALAYLIMIAILHLLTRLIAMSALKRPTFSLYISFGIGCMAVLLPRLLTSGLQFNSSYQWLEMILVGCAGVIYALVYRRKR